MRGMISLFTMALAISLAGTASAQTRAPDRAQSPSPQRPGLAAQPVQSGATLRCILKGVHVSESAVVLTCFNEQSQPNHYAAVFIPDEAHTGAGVLGQVLDQGMTPSGFPESVSYRIVTRAPTSATEAQCAIVYGANYANGTYRDCRRAISIGRGF